MKLANEDVSMLAFTSEQITAPFLLPEMVFFLSFQPWHVIHLISKNSLWLNDDVPLKVCYSTHMSLILFFHFLKVERVASMLNYFLLQLVGPQRKSLSLKDPEKYEFRPKHLLKQVGVYISFIQGTNISLNLIFHCKLVTSIYSFADCAHICSSS